MKIATWNLERPKLPKTHSEKNRLLLERLKEQDADIFVLTETNSCINLGPDYDGFPSREAKSSGRCSYTEGERRVTIWAKRKHGMIREIEARDPASCVCVALQTELGELIVYGTVIGILGRPTKDDLNNQIADWEEIGHSKNICIAGDFNTSFRDSYHFTHEARNRISECFEKLGIDNLTGDKIECIDHIAISKSFFKSKMPKIHEWSSERKNAVPRLSDHKGICVNLKYSDDI